MVVFDESTLPISDRHVYLRRWTRGDAPRLVEIANDPVVAQWRPTPFPYELRHAIDFIGRQSVQDWDSGTQAHLAVVRTGSDLVLGPVALRNNGRIGYITAADSRGRGVATAAARLTAIWGFEAVGLTRIE